MTTVGVGRPQRLWKPVGIFQQPFHLAGHVAFFQVIDHASELLSARFGHIGKDARFGHAAETVGFQPAATTSRPTACARTWL